MSPRENTTPQHRLKILTTKTYDLGHSYDPNQWLVFPLWTFLYLREPLPVGATFVRLSRAGGTSPRLQLPTSFFPDIYNA